MKSSQPMTQRPGLVANSRRYLAQLEHPRTAQTLPDRLRPLKSIGTNHLGVDCLDEPTDRVLGRQQVT